MIFRTPLHGLTPLAKNLNQAHGDDQLFKSVDLFVINAGKSQHAPGGMA